MIEWNRVNFYYSPLSFLRKSFKKEAEAGTLMREKLSSFNCMYRLFMTLQFLVFLYCPMAEGAERAEERKIIVTVGPSWEGFTNRDGSGLYHDILRQVYPEYLKQHLYVPTVQANEMVAIGRADIKLCETEVESPLMFGGYPMYENGYYALFRRERMGVWRGNDSLSGMKGVWRQGYYSRADFSVNFPYLEVRSGESALKMVILGRADFYIDDLALINESFALAGEEFDPDRFDVKLVGTRKYYPVFLESPRGKRLRTQYDSAMKRLYQEGILQKIYQSWGFPIPKLSHFTK